mgnify:CR=1 FL=1
MPQIFKKIYLGLFFFFFPCIVSAQSYHWIENGVHHFSNFQKLPVQKNKSVSDNNSKSPFAITQKDIIEGPSKQSGKVPVKRRAVMKRKSPELLKAFEQAKIFREKKEAEQNKLPEKDKTPIQVKTPELEKLSE